MRKTHAAKMAALKVGPGVFVYDGSQIDSESKPTVLMYGKAEPIFDSAGRVVLDAAGRQVFQRRGIPVRDERGQLILGGDPDVSVKTLDVYKLRGVEFAASVPVAVRDAELALKCRAMSCFREVEPGSAESKIEPKKIKATRQELQILAKDAGISISRSMSRDDIAEALSAAGVEVR